jgi:diguanylate cyclase (GGDEF)-like protein
MNVLFMPSVRNGLVALILGLLVVAVDTATAGSRVLRVGITSFRDKAVTLREWQPTMEFLSAKIPGTHFEAVPLNMPEFEGALNAKSLDFLITNPQHYITAEAKYGVSRIATLVKAENGMIVNKFGGVIFTRANNKAIAQLDDLRGKRIAATDRTSFAAYLIQYDLLREHGIDIEKESQLLIMGFPQDLSVTAVLDGRADAAFVRSGLIESMAREGKLNPKALKVINPIQRDDFPFLLSTALFPEWPLAAAPHVSFDITNQVVAALLLMPPDGPAAQIARYYRWSTPMEYQSVQNLMRRRHVYPFDAPEPLQIRNVVNQYSVQIVLGSLLVIAMVSLLYLRTFRLNQELIRSREKLSQMAHYDALTGLPNRTLLDDRIDQALTLARRSKRNIAVCLLDLDGFKPINDQFGHATGDRVLRDVATRMAAVLRHGDTVARLGGDEFVLVVNGFSDDDTLHEVLNRVLTAIAQPFDYCPDAPVKASIGVSIFNTDADDATSLMRHADEAMYKAKAAGGNRFVMRAVDSASTDAKT